jgi:Peptidase A4 family
MLKNRALTTVLLAALACAAESGTALAAPVPPAASSHGAPPSAPVSSSAGAARSAPHASEIRSIPALSLSRLATLSRKKANPRSTNWAGYAVTGGAYASVASNWVEPSVTCTANGIVGFWIGLDGWGSTSVEQDGTGVDCSSGSPQQFAWWETYPENSIQVYDAPVAAGDRMSSEVASEGNGQYIMALTDWTANWSERNVVSAPTAQNASAEIVAEAVTDGDSITALPDFGNISFTGSAINGGSLQSAAAEPIDMTDLSDNLIARTTAADQSGDFAVNYVGSTTQSDTTVTTSGSTGRPDGRTTERTSLVPRLESLLARL